MKKTRKARQKRKTEKAKQEIVKTEKRKPDLHLDNIEKAALWHMYLGAQSLDKIAGGLAITPDEARQVLERLESKLMTERRNLMGQYKLTESGLRKIEPRKISLDTKLNRWAIRHGQETDLWVTAKNSGAAPLNNTWLRITAPKFIDISRFSSSRYSEDDKNVVEFQLAQMHPGEAQHVNFKVKAFLTNGALASKYKIDVQALVDENETDKKELNISVAK